MTDNEFSIRSAFQIIHQSANIILLIVTVLLFILLFKALFKYLNKDKTKQRHKPFWCFLGSGAKDINPYLNSLDF